MADFNDLTGLFGIALALTMLCALTIGKARLATRVSRFVAAGVFALLLLPILELPLAAYVRGMVGDLSISTLVVLGFALVRQAGAGPAPDAWRRIAALLLLAFAAVALYPLALGAALYDSYRWGYGEPSFLGLLLVLALAALALRMPLLTVSVSFAVLAWAAGWYESANLWDYLIDPLLAVYGGSALFFAAAQGLRRR